MYKNKGIIALDLDGTLLNSKKELSKKNLEALYAASNAGFEIVPTTGRFYGGMPQIIRDLPFVRYVITINGAEVKDLTNGTVVYKAEIPCQQAIDLMFWLDQYEVIYDCYMENKGWMSISHKNNIDLFVEDFHSRKMLHDLRRPVPELKKFLMEEQSDVQKIQFFSNNTELRRDLMTKLTLNYPNLSVSSALPQNIEINQIHANKGEALLALADYLKIDHAATYAFGDGLNDLSMIKSAGMGIAMANSAPKVLSAADRSVPSCDEDGVAWGIETYILKSSFNTNQI
ncbi:MAG: HAD family phosphatase [Eubacterium sp.]|nr:HAD family phosphatase [Eubacterium sp.]